MTTVEQMRYRFTVDQYHHMADVGILKQHEYTELINGQVYNKYPVDHGYSACIGRLDRHFWRTSPERTIVFVKSSLQLSNTTEVLPDVMIVNYRDDAYEEKLATSGDAMLVVEVADKFPTFVGRGKLPLYANARIPEMWLVDVGNRRVEVYTQPSGDRFAATRMYQHGDTIESPTISWLSIEVAAIFG